MGIPADSHGDSVTYTLIIDQTNGIQDPPLDTLWVHVGLMLHMFRYISARVLNKL